MYRVVAEGEVRQFCLPRKTFVAERGLNPTVGGDFGRGRLAAYDSRDGYTTWGCRSAAHWLNWKCAMSLKTAHEHVRVANALQNLPVIRAAFAEGKLSYSKVRAMTRVADIDNEQSLCDVALCSTASQLEAVCAAFRIATSNLTETQSAAAAFTKRG